MSTDLSIDNMDETTENHPEIEVETPPLDDSGNQTPQPEPENSGAQTPPEDTSGAQTPPEDGGGQILPPRPENSRAQIFKVKKQLKRSLQIHTITVSVLTINT